MSGASASRSPRASRPISSRSDAVRHVRNESHQGRGLLEPDQDLVAVVLGHLDQDAGPASSMSFQRR